MAPEKQTLYIFIYNETAYTILMHDLASITTTFPKFWWKVREQQSSKLLMEGLIYQQQSSLLVDGSEREILQLLLA